MSDLTTIVKQIENTIQTMYRRQYPDAPETDFNDIVTYNPITRKVTFKNLKHARYLIIAPANASIISMLGHGLVRPR